MRGFEESWIVTFDKTEGHPRDPYIEVVVRADLMNVQERGTREAQRRGYKVTEDNVFRIETVGHQLERLGVR